LRTLVDFNVLVLATGSWPLQPPSTNFSIPKDLQTCEQCFVKFYQAQHSGRKLNWLHQLSKGELKSRYGKKYSFVTSTYQMGVLLHYNSNETMSTNDLQIATQLTDSALKNTLVVRNTPTHNNLQPPPQQIADFILFLVPGQDQGIEDGRSHSTSRQR